MPVTLPKTISQPQDIFERLTLYVYGRPGVGKSTFANGFPKPIFLNCEDGLNALPCYKVDTFAWEDIRHAIDLLMVPGHGYQTLVIDTMEAAFSACAQYAVERHAIAQAEANAKSGPTKQKQEPVALSEIAHGKGYDMQNSLWRELCTDIRRLPMMKVLLGHAAVKTVRAKGPGGREDERFKPLLSERAIEPLNGPISLTMCADHCLHSVNGKPPVMTRLLRVRPSDLAETKDRHGFFPETMGLSFKSLKAHWEKGTAAKASGGVVAVPEVAPEPTTVPAESEGGA